MNGISLMMMPISCCPMYNLGTSNNMKLIPRRLSNLHLQTISPPPPPPHPPLGTTTTMLKRCRVYSASSSSSGQDATWLRPEVGGIVIPNPNSLIGLCIAGLASLKTGEIVVQLILTVGRMKGNPTSICTWAAIIVVARFVVGKIHDWLSVVTSPSFSIGEVIKVKSVEGQVMEIGPLITSLRCAEGTTAAVTNSSLATQVIINKSRAHHAVDTKIYVQVDAIGKIPAISEDIVNMMKSNSNVYLEEEQPYCCRSGFEPHPIELSLVYKLKNMTEDKIDLAKHDILMQSAEIIMKHKATLA